ncbi:MAG: hypothetical protein GXP53_01745 [Deltaproteobacteria bacterium]|nr:hypothetical protein [Deltaproteobacteria bacterium]
MNKKPQKHDWIWVVVENTGTEERFVGLHDETDDLPYIPAFTSKEDAADCLIHMPTQRGNKYEVQAVMFEDLEKDAAEGGFQIVLADGEGKIVSRIHT